MIDGLLLLLLFQFIGELISRYLPVPVPGPVIGMVLLVVALAFKAPLAERVETASNKLIGHLALLYFPIGVGLVMEWHKFADYGWALLVSVVGGTLLAIVLVAWLSQLLLRGR